MDTVDARLAQLEHFKPKLMEHPRFRRLVDHDWDHFKQLISIQEYGADVLFVKHGSTSRIVHYLIEGTAEAYVVQHDQPELTPVYHFEAGQFLGELNGLFGGPRRIGLRSKSPCVLLVFDLDRMEHLSPQVSFYEIVFGLLHEEMGDLTTRIYNQFIQAGMFLRTLFEHYPVLQDLDETSLKALKPHIRYIFTPADAVVLTVDFQELFYIVESGRVRLYREPWERLESRMNQTQSRGFESQNRGEEALDVILRAELDSQQKKALKDHSLSQLIQSAEPTHASDMLATTQEGGMETAVMSEIGRYELLGDSEVMRAASESAYTLTPCCLLEIKTAAIFHEPPVVSLKFSLTRALGKHLGQRLHQLQEGTLLSLKDRMQNTVNDARFLQCVMLMILTLAGFAVFEQINDYFFEISTVRLDVKLGTFFVLACALANLMRYFGINYQEIGLKKEHFVSTVLATLGMSLFLMLVATAWKQYYVEYFGTVDGLVISDPYWIFAKSEGDITYWMFIAVYLFYTWLYEICIRGMLQTACMKSLGGRSLINAVISILASNLLVALLHVPLMSGFYIELWMPGLLWGWIFYRYGNLFGIMAGKTLCFVYILLYLS